MKFERYYHQNAATRISSALLRDVETGLRSVSVSDGAIAPNAVTNPIRNELTRRGWSGEVAWSFLASLSKSGGTDNRCNLDRIKRELPIFSLVITMPIAFYGIDRD